MTNYNKQLDRIKKQKASALEIFQRIHDELSQAVDSLRNHLHAINNDIADLEDTRDQINDELMSTVNHKIEIEKLLPQSSS